MMPTDDVRILLERAVLADEPPPGTGGPSEVFLRARRIRRRQRLVTGLASIAVLGVAASVFTVVSGGPADSGRAGQAAGPAPTPSILAAPTAYPSPGSGRVHYILPLQTLLGLLPPGSSTTDHQQILDTGRGAVELVDPEGRTIVEVHVGKRLIDLHPPGEPVGNREDPPPAAADFCDRYRGMVGASCLKRLPDGVLMATVDGPGEPGAEGVQCRIVEVLYPDGLRVMLREWNAVHIWAGPPTRSEPALTMDQLKDIALNPQWRLAALE